VRINYKKKGVMRINERKRSHAYQREKKESCVSTRKKTMRINEKRTGRDIDMM
jgi:hypothetical protein